MSFNRRKPPLAFLIIASCVVVLLCLFLFNRQGYNVPWQNPFIVKGPVKPNAVIVMLMSPSRLNQAIVAIRGIEDRFNHRLKYPYVLLTEANITDEIRQKVDWITEGRAKFADLPSDMWGIPESLDEGRVRQSMEKIGFTANYRSMCRFYSGLFWKHPAVAQYDYIWRLDTDIEFHCDVPYDPFVRMQEANALYSFVQISPDAVYIQPSLASNVSTFMATHRHLLLPEANHMFVWTDPSKALEGNAGNDEWTKLTFYDNWEISHRSFWESELYTSFFQYLDDAGGFFYERWGDAPVHTYAVSMGLRRDQVLLFDDMGYEHQKWPFECPESKRCTCVRNEERKKFRNNAHLWFNASSN